MTLEIEDRGQGMPRLDVGRMMRHLRAEGRFGLRQLALFEIDHSEGAVRVRHIGAELQRAPQRADRGVVVALLCVCVAEHHADLGHRRVRVEELREDRLRVGGAAAAHQRQAVRVLQRRVVVSLWIVREQACRRVVCLGIE